MNRIDVNTPWIPDRQELYALFDDILDRKVLTNNGKYVKQLEAELRHFTGCKYAYACSNGTIALHMALKALGIDEGEVITTPFSFIATTSSILWQGCKPVFVDIDPETLCINADEIESRITPKTKGIMSVHVFGSCCDIDTIEKIARKHGLATIYDGAHAFGVRYKGKSVFEYGSISTLSMHPTKILSSIEGGAIFCSEEELAEKIFKIRYFGKNAGNEEEILGLNGKMSEFNAAFGILSLRHFKKELSVRNELAGKYDTAVKNRKDIKLISFRHNDTVNHSYYPLIMQDEEAALKLIDNADKAGITLRRYWYPSLNTVPYVNADPVGYPISVAMAKKIVCLPIHSSLTPENQQRVIDVLT